MAFLLAKHTEMCNESEPFTVRSGKKKRHICMFCICFPFLSRRLYDYMIDLHMATAVTPLPDYNLFIQSFDKATAICHGTQASIHNSYAFPSAHIYIFFPRDFSPVFCVLSGPSQSVLVSKSKYKPKFSCTNNTALWKMTLQRILPKQALFRRHLSRLVSVTD